MKQYIILLQATSNNQYGLNKDAEYYAAGWEGYDYTGDLFNSVRTTDIETAREICNRINTEKDFTARICELNWSIGNIVK